MQWHTQIELGADEVGTEKDTVTKSGTEKGQSQRSREGQRQRDQIRDGRCIGLERLAKTEPGQREKAK